MFELDYRIIHSEYDDFEGQNGFFQIKCNGYIYGEIYPEEMETIMDKVSLYDWFERLAKVVKNLRTRNFVALSDVESYNTWIVFQRREDDIEISIVKAPKEQGTQDIEFFITKIEDGKWKNQVTNHEQFKYEVIKKGREYIKDIISANKDNPLIDKIKKEFDELD